MTTSTEKLLPCLIDADIEAAEELFGGLPDVHDPMTSRVTELFYFWAAARHMWLKDRKASLAPVAVTRAPLRAVVEVVLSLEQEGRRIDLPVAVVGEEEEDGRLRRVRLYHSTWPLKGHHQVRGALLPPREALRAPDVVGVYQDALARGDVEAVLATFAPDAVVREPSGGEHVHATPEARRAFYSSILASGGIPLDHCAVMDDGTSCAIEYSVHRWGKTQLYPQAGVAVYVRGAGGLLSAARIYDDVAPPG